MTMLDGASSQCQIDGIRDVSHTVGRFGTEGTGPRLVCIGGLHGNEPAGVRALQRVIDTLNKKQPRMVGEFIALVGNPSAISAGRRFLERDLNRVWNDEETESCDSSGVETEEEVDRLALKECLGRELDRRDAGELFVLDLHTTSGHGVPFVLMGDTLRNRALACQFPVPIILGLEEQINGTVTEYVTRRGAVTVAFEAGQHDAPSSVDRHEAAVWVALRACGLLAGVDLKENWRSHWVLQQAGAGLPRFMEVCYRHPVAPEDEFVMVPGFSTFQRVRAGEVLAADRHGKIAAPVDGRILLPLYQDQGDDGFFIAQPVKQFWLKLSALLRRLHADALVPLLPSVQRAPGRPGTLLVEPTIARWLSTEIFHLFGYRRRHAEDGLLVFTRRQHSE